MEFNPSTDFKTYLNSDLILNNGQALPSEGGLYAWYLDFSKFSRITTKKEFSDHITKIDTWLVKDKLDGMVASSLKTFKVSLLQERMFLNQLITVEDEEGSLRTGQKLENLTVEQCKDILSLLGRFKVLVPPLYVGIATSLKGRWRQHRSKYNEIRELIDGLSGEDDLFLNEELFRMSQGSFGGRIAARAIPWDYLVFACISADFDKTTIRETEFLLNRLYSPIFGRK